MKRALMYASVASMIQQFNMENIQLLQQQGYEVDVACNMEQGSTISIDKIAAMKHELENAGVNVFHISVPRKVTAVGSILRALRQTGKLMNEKQYTLVHCHSPIGGMICRLAGRFSEGYQNRKMIYSAHGFHFYQGAPIQNWLLFYPIEWLCSWFTDTIITINHEDYALAKEKMQAREVVYIPGIGVDTQRFFTVSVDTEEKRREIDVPLDAFMLLSVGELNKNKNHETIIRAMAYLDDNLHYVVAGKGPLQEYLVDLARKLGVADRVHLLGYRTDVEALYLTCDTFVFPSYREGLSVALMEAMAASCAVICSRIRGNTDLIQEGIGGWLLSPQDVAGFAEKIKMVQNDYTLRQQMGRENASYIENFSREKVAELMAKIYQ